MSICSMNSKYWLSFNNCSCPLKEMYFSIYFFVFFSLGISMYCVLTICLHVLMCFLTSSFHNLRVNITSRHYIWEDASKVWQNSKPKEDIKLARIQSFWRYKTIVFKNRKVMYYPIIFALSNIIIHLLVTLFEK